MKKDLRRIVSAAVCAICTLATGVCFAMTTMSARTGSTWEVEGFDRVFYQSDNHDSCKLYQIIYLHKITQEVVAFRCQL